MKNYKETYKGWTIESYGNQFRYFCKTRKQTMIGFDIPTIRKQIDHFLK